MSKLKWTGERVIPDEMIGKGKTRTHQQQLNTILMEHIARYNFAKKFCRGKIVLDASCGSGYGSEMLKDCAKSVLGVDNSIETIEYAKEKYKDIPDLYFAVCDLEEKVVLPNYEIIVSFETIEHLADPHKFLEYVKNCCTEKFIFSIPIESQTDFHKVLYSWQEIKDLIGKYFNKVEYFEQKKDKIYPFIDGSSTFIVGIAENK